MNHSRINYEAGLTKLLDQLGRDHTRYQEALSYQHQLIYNLAQTQRHGDTETRRSDRTRIIEQLNDLAHFPEQNLRG